jgi:predicted transcriptional regulator of viral defense system
LESALAYFQIIPERVYGVTSVTSKKTSQFESAWGIFGYRSVKPNLMFGYHVLRSNQGQVVLMASLEKTILDYLYLNSHIDSLEDFEGLRWDQEALAVLRHNASFDSMLSRFGKKALNHRVNQLMRYLDA